MAYSPTTWIAGVTSLGPTNLNKLESGLQVAASVADAAIPKPGAPTDRDVLYYDSATSSWKTGKLAAAMVAAGAGILKSQLASLAIADADVAVGAAINPNKIAAGLLGSQVQVSKGAAPPGAPVDGDLWLLPADAANGINWLFRYNAGSASGFKWEFIGGPPLSARTQTDETTVSATYVELATTTRVTVPRNGDYRLEYGARLHANGSGLGYMAPGIVGVGPLSNSEVSVAVGVQSGVTFDYVSAGHTAGQIIGLMFHSDSGTPSVFAKHRWLRVVPIRVS